MINKTKSLELWGSATRLAKALGCHASTIQGWVEPLSTRQKAQIIGVSIMEKGLVKTEAYFGALPR